MNHEVKEKTLQMNEKKRNISWRIKNSKKEQNGNFAYEQNEHVRKYKQ